jgi:hypothetical protein
MEGSSLPRAERRRIASAERKGLVIPDALDTRRGGWDRRLLNVIDKVYVNGVCPGQCEAYSVKAGWAKYQGLAMIVHGTVTITHK